MTFYVGEKVVYPNQGVGTIENISTRNFGARPERFYLLRLASSSLTVMVPFSHVNDVGLRKVTKNGAVERVLRYLADGECKGCRDWKNRFKEVISQPAPKETLALADDPRKEVKTKAEEVFEFIPATLTKCNQSGSE